MMAAVSALLALSAVPTTVEFFSCDFARALGYDERNQMVVGKKRYGLIVFIRRETAPVGECSAALLKVVDPTPLLSKSGLTATVGADETVVIFVNQKKPSDASLLIKGPQKGRAGRESWIMRSDGATKTLRDSPMYVGVCASAKGVVAENLLREPK